MMRTVLHHPGTALTGSVQLPASKSISNRVLVIQSLCASPFTIRNLSTAADTQLLAAGLSLTAPVLDAGAGGTTFRFLLAVAALKQFRGVLKGTPRLMRRPVQALVEQLRALGADIRSTDEPGFPPLSLHGGALRGGVVEVEASATSQFLSALLLIAPCLPGGLTILPKGSIVSGSYVRMTTALMAHFGVPVARVGQQLVVPEHPYRPVDFIIGADWSAAAFFYAFAALHPGSDVLLAGLRRGDGQGDEAIAGYMEAWGVTSETQPEGVRIRSSGIPHRSFSYDLLETPDLAQALAVLAAVSGRALQLTGLQTLRQKETDRLEALRESLTLAGAAVVITSDTLEVCAPVDAGQVAATVFDAYEDHRMVMALSLLAATGAPVRLNDSEQVNKSFPAFFGVLQELGFKMSDEGLATA